MYWGVLLTLVLVIFTSVIGMSLVRNQGFKNFVLMQQKMAAGENPAAEMIKSVSLIIAGLLLFITGLFHRLPRSSAFITAGAKASDSEVDAAFALFLVCQGGGFSAGTGGGNTFDGEYQRKDDERDRLDHKDDRRD